MSWNEEDDRTTYAVVVNHEEQYSIWPADRELPLGWNKVGKEGSKQACLGHIEEIWTDMRPLSLRKPSGLSGLARAHRRPTLRNPHGGRRGGQAEVRSRFGRAALGPPAAEVEKKREIGAGPDRMEESRSQSDTVERLTVLCSDRLWRLRTKASPGSQSRRVDVTSGAGGGTAVPV